MSHFKLTEVQGITKNQATQYYENKIRVLKRTKYSKKKPKFLGDLQELKLAIMAIVVNNNNNNNDDKDTIITWKELNKLKKFGIHLKSTELLFKHAGKPIIGNSKYILEEAYLDCCSILIKNQNSKVQTVKKRHPNFCVNYHNKKDKITHKKNIEYENAKEWLKSQKWDGFIKEMITLFKLDRLDISINNDNNDSDQELSSPPRKRKKQNQIN